MQEAGERDATRAPYADVCGRMRTYADVFGHMQEAGERDAASAPRALAEAVARKQVLSLLALLVHQYKY